MATVRRRRCRSAEESAWYTYASTSRVLRARRQREQGQLVVQRALDDLLGHLVQEVPERHHQRRRVDARQAVDDPDALLGVLVPGTRPVLMSTLSLVRYGTGSSASEKWTPFMARPIPTSPVLDERPRPE